LAKKFKFRNTHNIGAADAQEDKEFLEKCFVDLGYLDVLKNCNNPKRIVLGRTGAGKTALLLRLSQTTDRVLTIEPECLSLAHISNSPILKFLVTLDVHLDIFFKLLWRHILTVEIIRHHFKFYHENEKGSFLLKFMDKFGKSDKHQKALKYLREWGDSFWMDIEHRIKEVTTNLESNLKSSVNLKFPGS